ncbi:MAG: hypothetical protein HYV63_18795, partial [Candidatus Schekmanbacteria bacterium]|nr:hypothetical protein [Candidatus Schekmanbacteria bacterium]
MRSSISWIPNSARQRGRLALLAAVVALLTGCSSSPVQANAEWAKSGGSLGDDNGYDVAVNGTDGSVWVTGDISGPGLFNAGQEDEISTPSFGGADIFLARYASDGGLSWVAIAGGTSREEGWSVAVDSARDAAVIGGYFEGTATFGQGQSHETTLVAAGGWEDADLFVARYDVDGQLAWAKRSGSRKPEITTAVAVDPRDGSVVVAGVYLDPFVFGAGEENSAGIGNGLIFVAKYASDGKVIWARGVAGVDPEDTYISGNVQNLAVNGTDGSI